jgi:HSP20 family protein
MLTKSPEQIEKGLIRRDVFRQPLFESPFFRRFSGEMDRFFDELGLRGGYLTPALVGRETRDTLWAPDIEVMTEKEQLIVRADLPGIKPEDVKIEVTEEHLMITGERKREVAEHDKGFYRSERLYGQFCRTIPLPEGAIYDGAKAVYKNGVLEVKIPVPPRVEAKPKTVKIETVEEKIPVGKG